MKQKHDKIAKEDRPIAGKNYELHVEGRPMFEAQVTEYKGGCWIHLKINKPLDDQYVNVYKAGDEFKSRVAAYEFYPVEPDN